MSIRNHACANNSFINVLSDVRSGGILIQSQDGESNKNLYERLNYGLILANGRARIVANSLRTLALPVAAARFVWMMSGNNRAADIAFYEPRVLAFSDDGIIVPGSSYGARMLQSSPGVDQLRGVILRIKDEPSSTRRAAITIYLPFDAVRESSDIPCAFGMVYHPRGGKLHSTVFMRSNNAVTLLPFNLFEFSLLSEVIATECSLEMGEIYYFAASMHAFQRDERVLQGALGLQVPPSTEMPAMPSSPSPLSQIRALTVLEAKMRHESTSIKGPRMRDWIALFRSELDGYWSQFGILLLTAVARKNGDIDDYDESCNELETYFKDCMPPMTV